MVTVKRSPEIEALLVEWRPRMLARDNELFAETTADGEVSSFGSAAGEETIGRDAVLDMYGQTDAINEAAGLDPAPGPDPETRAWEAGDTGWAISHTVFTLKDGKTVPVRSTLVLARDGDGTWKAVHSSVHVLVPNEKLAVL